jgi:hypothetical protein
MKLNLRQQITQFAHVLQTRLFPSLEEDLGGELSGSAKRLVAVLEMIPLARFVPSSRGWVGRPSKDRLAIACAFVAKAVYGFTSTRQLLEGLQRDDHLRRLCGWNSTWQVPHEATFSRAFDEFSRMQLPQFVHEALIRETQQERLIGHIARDATAIQARERFPETRAQREARLKARKAKIKQQRQAAREAARQAAAAAGRSYPRGGRPPGPDRRFPGGKRPRRIPAGTRLERQRSMSVSAMLDELPRQCDWGTKTNSQGAEQHWRGYKLHLDVADGQIPISAVLTSASLHDSQVAIPLATMTTQRVTYLYELMDSAYDADHIHQQSRALGHVPIIDPHPRRQQAQPFSPSAAPELSWAQQDRYKERTMIERVNARLKDEFGGRNLRVRGPAKAMTHLMFGILALTADQILRMVVKRI